MKLLKFYTDWCCQCKQLSDKLKDFDMLPIENINCEEADEDILEKYQIRSLPTLILVDDDNNFLRKFIGLINIDDVKKVIKEEQEVSK